MPNHRIPVFSFYGGLFISLFVMFFFFGLATWTGTPSAFFKITGALADTSLLIFPLLFLRGKWKYLSLTVPFIVAFLLWINILYFRNFGDLIPSSLYLNNQAGDNSVVDSIIPSSKVADILLIIMPFLPVIITLCFKSLQIDKAKPDKFIILIDLFILLASWIITLIGSYRRIGIYNDTKDFTKIMERMYPEHSTSWIFFYNQHNFTGYGIRVVHNFNHFAKKLNREELDHIKEYISTRDNLYHSPSGFDAMDDSTNLILIVVESLPMEIMEMRKREKIIPFLTELSQDSAIIVKPLKVIVGLGRSSDAQFMYNTGLLPLRGEPLVANYANKDYPSIAKALGFISMEIIGERGNLWSHNSTTKSYGYDTLISDIASNGINQDSVIFHRAALETDNLPRPFFLFVSTLSMHDPYKDSKVTPVIEENDLIEFPDDRDKEYLQRVRHFDDNLRFFIQELKRKGIYENSIIMIVGDHDIEKTRVSEKLHDDAVPFIIINSPLNRPGNWQAFQTDVFPTIIDLFNVEYQFMDTKYTGLGKSIFKNPEDSTSSLPTEEDYIISDMLIRGSY